MKPVLGVRKVHNFYVKMSRKTATFSWFQNKIKASPEKMFGPCLLIRNESTLVSLLLKAPTDKHI